MTGPKDCAVNCAPLATASPGSLLVRTVDHFLVWMERARQRRHLAGLSHHMLRDIGLSRAEIELELHKRPWHE